MVVNQILEQVKNLKSKNFILLMGFFIVLLWTVIKLFYGWHPELYYLPLSVLYILSLLQERKKESFLWALLIVLTWQDGAIICCSLHLMHQYFIRDTKKDGLAKEIFKYLLICLFWIMIFALGLYILKTFGAPGEERMQKAFNQLGLVFQEGIVQKTVTELLNNVKNLFFPGSLLRNPL